MRRLLLLRHAKAERAEPRKSDIKRPLADEGRADAATMGTYMVRHRLAPDLAIVSPSERTRETFAVLAAACPAAPAVAFEQRVYDATPYTLINVIKEMPTAANTVLLVGHNPGLHEFATMLIGTGDLDLREQLREKFPTSGLAVIDFPLDDWARLHARAGRLERFVTPKTIARTTA